MSDWQSWNTNLSHDVYRNLAHHNIHISLAVEKEAFQSLLDAEAVDNFIYLVDLSMISYE